MSEHQVEHRNSESKNVRSQLDWLSLISQSMILVVLLVAGLVPSGVGQFAKTSEQVHLVPQFGVGDVQAVAYSPDDRFVLTASGNSAQLWDVATGTLLRTLDGHAKPVKSVSYSHNGKYALTTSADQTARLWEISTGRQIRSFDGHTLDVTCSDFSKDDKYGLTGGNDHIARLWEISSGRLVQTFSPDSTDQISSVVFVPGNQVILTGSFDGKASLWSVKTGKIIRSFSAGKEWVTSFLLSPDGNTVYTGSWDKTVRAWDFHSGRPKIVMKQEHEVSAAALSYDGRYLLSRSIDAAYLWDVARARLVHTFDGSEFAADGSVAFAHGSHQAIVGSRGSAVLIDADSRNIVRQMRGHTVPVRRVAMNDNTHILFTSGGNGSALWNTVSGEQYLSLIGKLKHYEVGKAFSFSQDGRTVAEGGSQGWTLLDGFSGMKKYAMQGNLTSLQFSPSGNEILVGGPGTLYLWDVNANKLAYTFKCPSAMQTLPDGSTNTVRDTAFSQDGGRVVAGLEDGTARVWDLKTGAEPATLGSTQERPAEAMVDSLAFLQDSKAILVVSEQARGATLTDAGSGVRLRVLRGMGKYLAQSPDGRHILTGSSSSNSVLLWDSAAQKQVASLDGNTGEVVSAAFSPDGRSVVTGSKDGAIRVWDAATATGHLLSSPGDHASVLQAVGFTADDREIVSFGYDRILRTWDARSGAPISGFKLPARSEDGIAASAAFSPDGRTLMTGALNGMSEKLWEVASGKLLHSFEGYTRLTRATIFSQDGKECATGSDDGVVRIWEVETGRLIASIDASEQLVDALAFSGDRKRVLSGGRDEAVRVWEVATGKLIRSLEGHSYEVSSVAYSRDGRFILTGSRDKTARLWDAATGQSLETLRADNPNLQAAAISPDGLRAATGGWGTDVRLWDTVTGTILRTFAGHRRGITSIAFSPDGRFILTGSEDGTARLWNVATGETLQTFRGHSDIVYSVTFSADGKFIVTGSRDDTAKLWETATGKLIRTFTGNTNSVTSVAISRDGSLIASGSFDATARVWDAATGEQKAQFAEIKAAVYAVAFTPDGHDLLTTSDSGKLRIWAIASKQLLRTFAEPVLATCLAVSPDGHTVATGDYGHSVRILDLSNGHELRRLDGHTDQVTVVTFDARGQRILSASGDLTARVWDAHTGDTLSVLGSQVGSVNTVALSNDGQMALTGNENGTVYLWDLKTASAAQVYRGHSGAVRSVAFFGNDRFVLTGGEDSTTRLWDRQSGSQLATLLSFADGGWAVVDPNGRFDTNNLDGGAPLVWVADNEPMRALPLEIFMRDYYTPRLLSRIMNHEDLPSVRSIAEIKNRVQPKVSIVSITASKTHPGLVDVVVHAVNHVEQKKDVRGTAETDAHGKALTRASGLQDLCLFRNGQLVANTPLDHPLKDGDFTFNDIQLPTSVRSATFTAYAFNSERIKSSTASKDYAYKPEQVIKPRAFLLQIGVNHYQAKGCDLHGSVTDAEGLSKALTERLTKRGLNVESMRLVSTDAENGATKEGIKEALQVIAAKATPDDVFFLSFSGHGYGDKSGQFYLLPSDIEGNCTGVDEKLLRHAISADELAEWLRPIDAGEMTFVLDSCQSASSVEANDFKPGPMGSRGLGQLAYDKRIRILAASQGNQAAQERDQLPANGSAEGRTQGVLSYVLTEQGLVEGKADWKPADGKITVGEWLTYAADAVPKSLPAGANNTSKGFVKPAGGTATPSQIPAVFDFSKKDSFVLQEGNVRAR